VNQPEMIKHDSDKPITRGWHLDKRITVSHLFTTIAFVVGLGSALYALDTRVANVEYNLGSHVDLSEVKREGIQLQIDQMRAAELAEVAQSNLHQAELIARMDSQTQRLEIRLARIEDGVNRHIESTLKQHLDSQ
jgi:hypothetical protein